MTGDEHYRQAELLLRAEMFDAAQVHATLALAYATAVNGTGSGSSGDLVRSLREGREHRV